jgi:predicted MPP superfamily phosphohydrolase
MRGTLAALWWAAAIVLAAVGVLAAREAPSVTRLQLSIPTVDRDGAEPFRLVVISDTHLGAISSIPQWRRTLAAALTHDPYALIVAGDLIDDSTPRAAEQAAMIREFFPDETVYAVTGNHERYAGLEFFERLCQKYRFKRLRGASEPILPGFSIAGIDDRRGDAAQPAVVKALSAADGALLFIAHRPEAARFLSERPMTLAIVGHTHGGQIPPMNFLTPLDNGGFSSGHYQVGKAHLYVSRGAGVWGPPMRLLAPSEIVLVEVSAGAEFGVSTGAP